MADPAQDGDISSQGAAGFPNAMRALQAAQGRQEGTLRKEGAEMAPGIQGAAQALSQPRPQRPELEKVPEPPGTDTGKPGQEWIGAVTLLAGIAGAFTRQHLTSALTAFSAGIQGLKKGQTEAYQQAYTKWKAESDRATSNNRMVLDEYKTALEDRQASIDEQMQRINLTAIKFKDQIMADAASVQNATLVAQIFSQQSIAHMRLEEANARIEQQHGLAVAKLKEDAAKNGLTYDESTGQFTLGEDKDDSALHTQAKAIAEYRQAPLSSGTRNPINRLVMAEVMKINPQYRAEMYGQINKSMQAFSTGPLGNQVRSISVAIDHMDTAEGLIDALQNGDIQLFNRARQEWAEQTGSEAPTDLQTAAHIIGQEMVKSIVAGGGGVTERQQAEAAFVSARSPEQLKGALKVARQLLAGQERGLKRQYENATQGLGVPFDDMLSPRAKEVLGSLGKDGPASGHKPGDIIKVGNKSYRVIGGDPSDPDVEEVK